MLLIYMLHYFVPNYNYLYLQNKLYEKILSFAL